MGVQEQHSGNAAGAIEPVGQPPGAAVEVRNAVVAMTVGHVVQADTIGTVEFHNHPVLPAPPLPRQLPSAPLGFVGRLDLLAELDRRTTPDRERGSGAVVISAIGGTGGIGKTWLALAWAHRTLHRFPDGQLAVDLRGFSPGEPRHAVDVLGDFLAALGVPRDQHPADLDARVALYRTHTSGKRMLILLDNAAATDQVVPLLPGGGSCTVLVTSRDRLRGLVARHSAHPLNVDVLTDAEAHTLLMSALDNTTTGSEQLITELVGLCGGFPLALGLIAARIRAHPALLAEVVAELRDLGLDALDSEDPDASLPTVLSWSLRHLTDEQRTLFGLLGIAPGPDTTLPAVVALLAQPPDRARRSLSGLTEAFLIERLPLDRYVMHDLVREYAMTTAPPDEPRARASARVMDFYLHTAHAADRLLAPHRPLLRPDPPADGVRPQALSDTEAAMAWLAAEQANLLATQRAAVVLGHHHVVWYLAWALDTFLIRQGLRRDALDAWRAALDAAAHLPDPAARVHTHRLLGRVCSRLNLREETTEHLNQALVLAVRLDDCAEQAHTHQVLAADWGRRGDDQRALDHATHALHLYRTLDRSDWEADALNAVGWFAARLGEFDAARDHCRAALTLHLHHDDHDGEAAALDSLGFIAHRTGDDRQAVEYYHRSLVLLRADGQSYQIAGTLDNVGHPHMALGQRAQAREVWQEALLLFREQGRDADADRVQYQLDLHDLNEDPARRGDSGGGAGLVHER
ncbi:tetratricopeptide (TPR) repeat protein [Actinokineospora baliensis]|uniref:ATP-binding protein n=1 Tax=Actinokineospora baliensis TaxID=547056 RepID=UPI001EF7C775|nr:tetratricopeptide repeat protein [Actinokineospora baliensis]MBM7773882.1 tetratricopeptide (TPR) repeat protein [Actinokineospora baliensis]